MTVLKLEIAKAAMTKLAKEQQVFPAAMLFEIQSKGESDSDPAKVLSEMNILPDWMAKTRQFLTTSIGGRWGRKDVSISIHLMMPTNRNLRNLMSNFLASSEKTLSNVLPDPALTKLLPDRFNAVPGSTDDLVSSNDIKLFTSVVERDGELIMVDIGSDGQLRSTHIVARGTESGATLKEAERILNPTENTVSNPGRQRASRFRPVHWLFAVPNFFSTLLQLVEVCAPVGGNPQKAPFRPALDAAKEFKGNTRTIIEYLFEHGTIDQVGHMSSLSVSMADLALKFNWNATAENVANQLMVRTSRKLQNAGIAFRVNRDNNRAHLCMMPKRRTKTY